jgi:glycine/D-amino acid oxidase-like deaminating enzyme
MTNNRAIESLKDSITESVWQRDLNLPQDLPQLIGEQSADLVIVGAGFTGLWTAILAKDINPACDVVIIDAHDIGYGASSRNGGFISESLTHGLAHGLSLWPKEMQQLLEYGRTNFAEIQEFVRSENIDAELVACGKTAVATRPHEVDALKASVELHNAWGETAEFLTRDEMKSDVHSPTFLAGMRVHTGGGLMNPAKLLSGLTRSALRRGIRIYVNSPVNNLNDSAQKVRVESKAGSLSAQHVVLATNAFTPLKNSIKHRVMPIFDHVLATQPLTAAQLDSIGWKQGQGLTDSGNQFHYFRKTADGRILWGGYDANYYYGNDTRPIRETRPASHELLATQFVETFPTLEGINFEYKWAGLIDSTSRFTPFYDVSRTGRVGTVVGFTGLGVGSSRFGAKVILDLLWKRDTDLVNLEMVRRKPFPIPPEPVRYPVVAFTRWSLTREDKTGKRGLWLRLLDFFGVGFNS